MALDERARDSVMNQIESLRNKVNEIDNRYENREDDFLLHSLLGELQGSVKAACDIIEKYLKNE